MTAAVIVAVAALGAAGCIVVPPSQATVGVVGAGAGAGYRASAGAHSAAINRADDAELDLGAGWVTEGGADREAVHGTYIALGRRVAVIDRRVWLSLRAEQFWLVDTPGLPLRGVAGRIALRRHLAGVGSTDHQGRGAALVWGGLAIGLYGDVGARQLEGGGSELYVAAGVSLDLPLLAAASGLGPKL